MRLAVTISGKTRGLWQRLPGWVAMILVAVELAGCSDRSANSSASAESAAVTNGAVAGGTAAATNSAPPTAATPGHPFVNSLGMKFVALPGTRVLACIWETRVQDFAAFVAATGYDATAGMYSLETNRWQQVGRSWKTPGFPQTEVHPVCGVSWEDARAFCEWLSKKEGRTYRLPTDLEWSAAVGLGPEPGTTPKERDEKIADIYPWGRTMPPRVNGEAVGNYPGSEAALTNWPISFRFIEGQRDEFPRTAPVGSFPANRYGLFDIGGNVWEWCDDRMEPGSQFRVVRGASWVDNLANLLLSSHRQPGKPTLRNSCIGFRCVIELTDSPGAEARK